MARSRRKGRAFLEQTDPWSVPRLHSVSSDKKRDFTVSLGTETCFDLGNEQWTTAVLALTDGVGVTMVFDPAGTVALSLKCLARAGTILVIGFAATQDRIERSRWQG